MSLARRDGSPIPLSPSRQRNLHCHRLNCSRPNGSWKLIQPDAIFLAELISILIYERIGIISSRRKRTKTKIEIIFNKKGQTQSQTHSAIIFCSFSSFLLLFCGEEKSRISPFYLIYWNRISTVHPNPNASGRHTHAHAQRHSEAANTQRMKEEEEKNGKRVYRRWFVLNAFG